jgi:uncharacterized membrane protein (GlpM family)
MASGYMRQWAACLAAFVHGATALVAVLIGLAPNTSYPEFVVGDLAWTARTKGQDLLALPLALLVVLGTYALVHWLLGRVQREHGEAAATAYAEVFSIASILTFLGIGSYFFNERTDLEWFLVASAVTLMTSYCAYESTRRGVIDLVELRAASMVVALIPFVPSAVALALRVDKRLPIEFPAEASAAFRYALAFGTALQLLTLRLRSRWLSSQRILLVVQLVLPGLFFALIPPEMVDAAGAVFEYGGRSILLGVVALLIALAYFELLRAWRRPANGLVRVAPTAVFALVVLFRAGIPVAPTISTDDYHFGESLVGAFRLVEHGAIPYVDYLPAHGLIEDDLAGLLSYALFDGTAGTIPEANRLALVLLAFIAFHATYRATNNLLLAFASTALTGGRRTWLFFVPFVAGWVAAFSRLSPLAFLRIVAISAPLLALGVPPQGILLIAAFSPLMLYAAYLALRADRRSFTRTVFAILASYALVLVTPLGASLLGAVRYVLVNAGVNQVAYAVPWAWSHGARPYGGLAWEVVRSAWVVAPLTAFAVARSLRRPPVVLGLAAAIAVFSLLLVPYTMGRIDPNAHSRSGWYTYWVLAFLLPFLLDRAWSRTAATQGLVLSLALGSFLGPPFDGLILSTATVDHVQIGSLENGAAIGLPGLGRATVDPNHLVRLRRIAREIRDVVDEGGAYLDLTNRNANHAYLRLPPVTPTPAPYNMPARAQQLEAIRWIERLRPRVALLGADNVVFSGGTLPLRSHALYRYVLAHAAPYVDGPYVFGRLDDTQPGQLVGIEDLSDPTFLGGVARESVAVKLADAELVQQLQLGDRVELADGTTRAITAIDSAANSITLEGAALDAVRIGAPHNLRVLIDDQRRSRYRTSLFKRLYWTENLQQIPTAWGRSFKTLEASSRRAVEDAQLRIDGDGMVATGAASWRATRDGVSLTLHLARPINGTQAALLRFKVRCPGHRDPVPVRVTWSDADAIQPDSPGLNFEVREGMAIVPLDTDPRWLVAPRIETLRISIEPALRCAELSIEAPSLWNRVGT